MPETIVEVNCSIAGAPSQEFLDRLRAEAEELIAAGEFGRAARVIQEAMEHPEQSLENGVTERAMTEEEEAQHRVDQIEGLRIRRRLHRQKRNQLLANSDWSQLADIGAQRRAAWQPYRQALRDLVFPDNGDEPNWPVPPEQPPPEEGPAK